MMMFKIVVSAPRQSTSRTEEGNVIHGFHDTVISKQCCRDLGEILVRNQGHENQLLSLAAVVGPPLLHTSRIEQRNVMHGTIHAKQHC
jgi:hypothetical protein